MHRDKTANVVRRGRVLARTLAEDSLASLGVLAEKVEGRQSTVLCAFTTFSQVGDRHG
jgi:hypothetical protein